ncbi:MAG: hypothetical protein JWM90_2119 [Thermoleophilia bacterium]|nr:hypothetical protein [Thermoleophilia bacterium]
MTLISEGRNVLTRAAKLLDHVTPNDTSAAAFAVPELRSGAATLMSSGHREIAARITSGSEHLVKVLGGTTHLDEGILRTLKQDATAGAELLPNAWSFGGSGGNKFNVEVSGGGRVLAVGNGQVVTM